MNMNMNNNNEDNNQDEDERTLLPARTFFTEKDSFFATIHTLIHTAKTKDPGTHEPQEYLYIQLCNTLSNYQEQPQLLDPFLPEMIELLFDIVDIFTQKKAYSDLQYPMRVLYTISKVRGPKAFVKYLRHEVLDVANCWNLLKLVSDIREIAWEVRYVLLLWMSIVILIPFDLKTIESSLRYSTLIDEILELCKKKIVLPGKERNGACALLARLLSRPDIITGKLDPYLDWAYSKLLDPKSTLSEINGTLLSLADILKIVKREELLLRIQFFEKFLEKGISVEHKKNSTIRHLHIKIVQRIGLTMLKPRIAPWRYQRGKRSLQLSLQSVMMSSQNAEGKSGGPILFSSDAVPFQILKESNKQMITMSQSYKDSSSNREEENGEDMEISESFETIIDILLNALNDDSTNVRWSAAKGIGRMTDLLPMDFGDEIVQSVIQILERKEVVFHNGWHGSALAIAELTRRGLLLPNRLPFVIPLVIFMLQCNIRQGSQLIGTNIRDASCYVFWAFARAYDPRDLTPYVLDIAVALIQVSLFDREITCRRAAAAAFQEHVGRQKIFPHGIEILPVIDFYSLSNRAACYLSMSKFVASFEEYKLPIINHLLEVKIHHWDQTIRFLAADALCNLASLAPSYLASKLLSLLQSIMSPESSIRQGSLLAIGKIILGLSKCDSLSLIDAAVIHSTNLIVEQIRNSRYWDEFGSEYQREAVCIFIGCCALAGFPLDKEKYEIWFNALDYNVMAMDENMQETALDAFKYFLETYVVQDLALTSNWIERYVKFNLKDSDALIRSRSCLALGKLSFEFFESIKEIQIQEVLSRILEAVKEEKVIETRRDTLIALKNMVPKTISKIDGKTPFETIDERLWHDILAFVLDGFNDYTIDDREDHS